MKRISTLLFVLLALSMALAACGGSASSAKIRVATDATWPPFESIDEATKQPVGLDIDLLNAIAKKAGLEIEYINVGFDPLLAGIAQCQYDAAISAMTITEERKQSMLFSDPYFAAGQLVTVRSDNTDITGRESLAGKKVGAQIGTTGALEIEKIAGAELKTYDEIGLAIQDLMNGQLDAVVVDDGLARAYIAKNGDKLKAVGQAFTDEAYGIAVCKTKTDLLAKINKGLEEVKKEGLIDQLNQKWLVGN